MTSVAHHSNRAQSRPKTRQKHQMRIKSPVHRAIQPIHLPDSEKTQLGIIKLDVYSLFLKSPQSLLYKKQKMDYEVNPLLTPSISPQPNVPLKKRRRGRPAGTRSASVTRDFRHSGTLTPPMDGRGGCMHCLILISFLISFHQCVPGLLTNGCHKQPIQPSTKTSWLPSPKKK